MFGSALPWEVVLGQLGFWEVIYLLDIQAGTTLANVQV